MSSPDDPVPSGPSEWIIENVMPACEPHLIAGAPGVGKTSLILQLLPDVEIGTSIWGRRVFPTKSVFISCDRSAAAHDRRLKSLGLPADRFPFFSGLDHDLDLEVIVKACTFKWPDRRLLFIDGFTSLCGSPNDYPSVHKFMRSAANFCKTYQITILGSVHASKSKEGQGYRNPREQILGSTAWAGFADLIMSMQFADPGNPEDPLRILSVCTRASAGDFVVKYRKLAESDGGILVPEADAVETDLISMLEVWVLDQPLDRLIPRSELVEYAKKTCAIPERTADRWLASQVEDGRLSRPKKGMYQRVLIQ